MKDFIFYVIIAGFFLLNIYSFYKDRNKYNSTYRVVYFSRLKDWLFAILIIFTFIPALILIEPSVPEFLKFGLFSLLEKNGTNANIEIIEQSNKISPYLTITVFIFLLLIFPKAAYYEEKKFRHGILKVKDSIKNNIKFGLVHLIVGIPIWVALALSLIGFLLTFRYILEYKKMKSYQLALDASTSLHGKYNTVILLIVLIKLLY